MIYSVSEYALTELPTFVSNTSTNFPIRRFPWSIVMTHRTGGHIKTWNIGANDNEIKSLKWGIAEVGCMDLTLSLNVLTIPFYYGNEITVYYNGVNRYRGYVTEIPDDISLNVKCEAYFKRLQEIAFNSTFTNYTFKEMLQEVIVDKTTATNVYYNDLITDINTTDAYSASYEYEPIKKLLDDYIDFEDDAYCGVNENQFLYIQRRSSVVNKNIYVGNYGSLKPKKDYSKIKETRYHVYQEDAGGDDVFIASIPDGTTSYPYLSLEAEVGVKENKLTAPKGLNSTECKDYAYAKLTAQQAPENIKISDLDISKIDLKIGEKVTVFDSMEKRLHSIITCDTTEGWDGDVTPDSDDYVEGDGSITFDSQDTVCYDFGSVQNYKSISKIGMMIKCANVGNIISLAMSSTVSPVSPYTTNLLINGDFATTENWTFVNADVSSGVVQIVTAPPTSFSGQISQSTDIMGEIVPGGTYRLTCDIISGTTDYPFFVSGISSANIPFPSSIGTGNELEFVASTSPSSFVFYTGNSGGTVEFDNLVLTRSLTTYISTTPLEIKNANCWQYLELASTQDFRYIGFEALSTDSATIKIDDIRLLGYFNRSYTGNVIKLDYTIDKNNDNLYNAEIGQYNPLVNDDLFRLEKRIRDLE